MNLIHRILKLVIQLIYDFYYETLIQNKEFLSNMF